MSSPTKRSLEFVARVRRFLGLSEDARCASPPSRRSTGCHARCATRKAISCRRRRAATAMRAKTSPPMCGRSTRSRSGCGRDHSDVFEVRGEVYMTHADFAALNVRQEGVGDKTSSPIRATRRLVLCDSSIPTITARRPLHFFAYGWGETSRAARQDANGRDRGVQADSGCRSIR